MHPCLRLAYMPPPPPPPPPPSASLAFPSSKTTFRTTSNASASSSSSSSSSSRDLNLDLDLRTPTIATATATSGNRRRITDWDRTLDYLSHSLGIQDPLAAVSRNPALRSHPLPSLQHSHSLLLSAGLSPAQIARLCSSFPLLLTHPNLAPALDFLRPLLPPHHLPLCLSRCPRLLLTPVPSQLLPALRFLRTLSIPLTPSSSILLISDVEHTLLPKLFFLRSHSIPLYDLKYIFRKFPKILTFSIPNNLHPKILFLQNHMNLRIRTEIRRFPQYFAFSLENRIKRRYRILQQNGLRMPLQDMLRPSDAEFEEAILDIKLRPLLYNSPHHHPLTQINGLSPRNL